MGLPTNIKTLLSGNVVEWARIEFKETWDAEASLKTICAFANDIDNWGGGYLVIGVEDKDGKPTNLKGVPAEKIDSYLKDLLNKCKQIQPEYMPITEVVDYKEKKFIIIWAPGGIMRPYSSPKSMAKGDKERVCWIRKMASTIAPTEEEKRDLYNLANNVPFDDRINHEADITDLNITLMQSYLKEVGSSLYEESKTMDFLDLCKNMNIVNSLPEYIKPKNVGLMFFCLNPQRFFPYAQIDVVQFPDGLGGDTIIEKIFKGPIHQQLREALLYISNTIVQERVQKLPEIAEARRFFNYPYEAIEEALANAVYHKGYNEREPIEVRVLPDRIEIVSHPGPDRSITMDGLKNYRVFNRRYRNRRIGEFLKELHLTEGRNTGFGKILRALEKNGSPKPLFETDDERTSFATTIFIHPGFVVNGNDSDGFGNDSCGLGNDSCGLGNDSGGLGNDSGNLGNDSGSLGNDSGGLGNDSGGLGNDSGGFGNDSGNDSGDENQNDNAERILKIMMDTPRITINQIVSATGISKRTVSRIIKECKEKGIVRREGTKNGMWIVSQ